VFTGSVLFGHTVTYIRVSSGSQGSDGENPNASVDVIPALLSALSKECQANQDRTNAQAREFVRRIAQLESEGSVQAQEYERRITQLQNERAVQAQEYERRITQLEKEVSVCNARNAQIAKLTQQLLDLTNGAAVARNQKEGEKEEDPAGNQEEGEEKGEPVRNEEEELVPIASKEEWVLVRNQEEQQPVASQEVGEESIENKEDEQEVGTQLG
jgi:hypothetical protein